MQKSIMAGRRIYMDMIKCIRTDDLDPIQPPGLVELPCPQQDTVIQRQTKHEYLMKEIEKQGKTDQKALEPDAPAVQFEKVNGRIDENEESDDFSYDDEDCSKALAIKIREEWNEDESQDEAVIREERLNKAFYSSTQQQYMMRQRSSSSLPLAGDGYQRMKAYMTVAQIRLERKRHKLRSAITSSSSTSTSSPTSSQGQRYTSRQTAQAQMDTTPSTSSATSFTRIVSFSPVKIDFTRLVSFPPLETATTSSSTSSNSSSAFAFSLLQNDTTSTPPSATLLNTTPMLPMDSTSSSTSSGTVSSPTTTQSPIHRINIFTTPFAFELMYGSSFFSSGDDAKINYAKTLEETELPTDGEIYEHSDITKQLEGLDEEGCLAITFLPCNKIEQRVGFMTGLELKANCTSKAYGIKMRPTWGVIANKYIPELPKHEGFTPKANANFKTLMVSKNIFGWLKDQDSGELCIQSSKEEAFAFIDEIKMRLAQLTPVDQGGNVDAELVVQPPFGDNLPSHIWIKLPGLILRQLGLTIYVYASRHVFVVDNNESLLLLGKMPFTKNLQPEASIAATTGRKGKKRKRC
jgi:hypothetical protein